MYPGSRSARPDPFSALLARFADDLEITTDGPRIRWTCGDLAATIEPAGDVAVAARFYDRPSRDERSGDWCVAIYRRAEGYALDESGACALASDLVDFFSGAREPRFAFVDVRCL